jgi:hypothetical protein
MSNGGCLADVRRRDRDVGVGDGVEDPARVCGGQGHQGDYLTKVNKAKYLKKSDLVSRIINNKTNLKQTFLNFNFFITKKLYRQDFFSNKKIYDDKKIK